KELRVSEKVIFTGNIDYRELPDVYNAADIVALCSRTEGFGLSITEGMSCGKPIIGTNAGGIPLQVKDKENGFLVERGDSDATADRIITLLEDEQLRKRFGEKSQEIVDMHFKLEAGIDKHIHLYKEVMKEKDEARCLEKMNIEQVSALITDFDRTLTDTPGVVKKQTIEKLKELDTIHILATGRVLAYVQELAKKYSLWDCIVCENGAVIYFPDSKKTIAVDSAYMKEARALVSAQIKEAMVGMVIISVPRTAEEKVKHLLKNTSKHLNYVYNVDEMMILPKFINKGSGVAMALDYLGIEADQTIVVGDGENDLDMFRTPGFNVAVANAHPKLKLISDQITKNPASAGVEEIAEKLLSD
ncbi:phosphoglycolate phosphatase, partial [Candidatus Woesearchaeota archaeon CG_4_10_14_0_8_um_filter_47_5]